MTFSFVTVEYIPLGSETACHKTPGPRDSVCACVCMCCACACARVCGMCVWMFICGGGGGCDKIVLIYW